ncbi:MAG: ATP-binding protein, partial [Nitrospirales bacterium]
PAVVQDHCCISEGAEYCEWTFTWQPQANKAWAWLGLGVILGFAVIAMVQAWSPHFPTWLKMGLAMVPGMICWLAGRLWQDRQELHAQGKTIQEQLDMAETQHEELREAYAVQEQMLVELRSRVAELTMIHQVGLTIGSMLERDMLIQAGLETIISDLPYERAFFLEYDPQRSMAHDGRLVGGPPELAEAVKSFEIPVVDWSHEATVFKKGKSLLIDNAKEAFPGFHPLHQQLMTQLQTQSLVAVPVKVQQRIIGALVTDRLEANSFSAQDVNLLTTVASQLAIALDNASAYSEIEQLNIGLEAKVQERTVDLETLNGALAKANARLREVDSLKSAFLSHCSHELRTPLTSMKGFIENLLEGVVGESLSKRQVMYLERMKSNTDRLTRMIADLLDLSRIESQTLRITYVPVTLVPFIQDVLAQFQFVMTEKCQQVDLICAEPDMTMVGDSDRLNQIVTNLLHNAIKFTPAKGTIRVEVGSEPNEWVSIVVSDSGCGIPAEALPQLFTSFYQVHADHEGETEGLGLGLAIVKTLVDLHGGQITVQSELGKGTAFTVMLPRHHGG